MFNLTPLEAIKKLGIEDYGDRIFNSNSHGELMHLYDYVVIAEVLKEDTSWFRAWFVEIVSFAEKNWSRPESVFQHIPRMLQGVGKACVTVVNTPPRIAPSRSHG